MMGGSTMKTVFPVVLCLFATQIPGLWSTIDVLPTFILPPRNFPGLQVKEDQALNESIYTVLAEEGSQSMNYSLEGSAAQFLEIDAVTGQLFVKAKLEYDNNIQLVLDIFFKATDSEGEFQVFETTIEIQDANDNAPEFNQTFYNVDVREDAPIGTTITSLNVTDIDYDQGYLSVNCERPTEQACVVFRIEPTQVANRNWFGYLVLNASLDFERTSSYSVPLIASDGKNSKKQEVLVGVIDINDSPPAFVRAEGQAVEEGLPAGTFIDYVSAVDTDGEGSRRPIRYELYGDEEALRFFSLTNVGGNISNIVTLDYEQDNRTRGAPYTLMIRARELLDEATGLLGNDSLTTATTAVRIRVLDVNDNCPQFDQQVYVTRIREDIAQGSAIGLQMEVTDADSTPRNQFRLELIDPSGTFQVSPTDSEARASVTLSVVDASNIDYDTPPSSYNLTVRAIPTGITDSLVCSSSALVRIILEDVNDQRPIFSPPIYRTRVEETAVGGTFLIRVTATDLDSPRYGTPSIRYSLIGNGENLFNIDPLTGDVTVQSCPVPGPGIAPCIDYEKDQSYDLLVSALDNEGAQGGLPGTAQLIIDVINMNDNAPVFTAEYVRSIREGDVRPIDGLVVSATDRDNNNIIYSIPPNQAEAALWQINNVTGDITAIRPIRYSDVADPNLGTFEFEVQASDGRFVELANVKIRVIDINDNVPIFQPVIYRVQIREDTPGNTTITQVTVSDADAPTTANGQVDVSIDSGGSGKFTVIPRGISFGRIITDIITTPDATFDYDATSAYTLIVKARDRGTGSNTGTATVYVDILDINNKNPYFDPPSVSVTVLENRPVGFLVTTVTAKDVDADSNLEISFTDPIRAFNPRGVNVSDPAIYGNLFSIDNNGNVRVNQSLDRDVVSFLTYTLRVRDVTPALPQEGEGALFIRILEYNDQAPYFEFPFYVLNVTEELPLASVVGSLLALDEDDDIRAYQLVDNPGDLFSISINSGVLRVNGRLDYERQHNVTLIAQAFDNGSPSLQNTTTVFINIININDNTPVFNQTVYQIRLPEHSTRTDALMAVSASDLDEGDYGVVEYTANNTYFTVDRYTGEIFLKPGASLDREMMSTYTFQVTAYDSPLDPSVRLSTTAPVYVILDDINDNCPMFTQTGIYTGSVIETADIGDQVLELYAEDFDDGINRRIKFTIDRSSMRPPEGINLFSIESIPSLSINTDSGRIEVNSTLRRKSGVYNFTVVASDKDGDNSTGDMCSTRTSVSIRVQTAINSAPVWVIPPYKNFSIDVLESQYNGMLVYDCKATDVNTGNAGKIDYYFNVRQNLTSATAEFHINTVTCVIRAQVVFDREQVDSYVLTVVAKDRGDPSASSETVLIVNVLDVNDNDPEFPMQNGVTKPIVFSIREGEFPPNGVIGAVKATDRDTDHKNNKIYYEIVAGNDKGYFVLGRESGIIRLSSLASNGLDREEKSSFFMDILAYNEVSDDTVIRNRRRRSTNPSIVTVEIQVEDVNDTPPRFSESDYHGCIPRDARYGQSIVQVAATDEDSDRGQFIGYSKVSESSGDFFGVDDTLGIVRNVKMLNGIESQQPVLRIRANDNPTGPSDENNFADTDVKIFVTDTDNEVLLVVDQPSADVRYYRDQLVRVMINSSTAQSPIHYVCIREIKDHIDENGVASYVSSDVYLSAVGGDPNGGGYFIYKSGDLRNIVTNQLNDERTSTSYRSLYVKSVETESEDDELSLTEDPVLAIFIIAILLIFLAIILFCLACCLIRNSKKKKMKKLRAEQHTRVEVVHVQQQPPADVVASVNPVYDNKGYQGEEEYAVVQKRRPAPEAVGPPIIPVMVPVDDDEPQNGIYEDTVPELPSQETETVIITEPIMTEEPLQEMTPPPQDFFEVEPIVEAEVPPQVDVEELQPFTIETEVVSEKDFVMPDVEDDQENAIEVEIRDSPPDSPHGSVRSSNPRSRSRTPSPPPPPDVEDFHIEASLE